MSKRLSKKQLEARSEALHEAAEHLHMDWTDDTVEWEEGKKMAAWIEKQSVKWGIKALEKTK